MKKNREMLVFLMDTEDKREIEEQARVMDLSMAQLIRKIIKDCLKK